MSWCYGSDLLLPIRQIPILKALLLSSLCSKHMEFSVSVTRYVTLMMNDIILGECSALWGEREELYGAL